MTTNECIINLKKGKTEAMLLIFGTSKRLNLFHGKSTSRLSVNGPPINITTSYKLPRRVSGPKTKFDTRFLQEGNRKSQPVTAECIRSSTDIFSAQRIYRTGIMPVLTSCGHNSLGQAESLNRMICCIENRSLEIISLKSNYPQHSVRS